MDLNYQNFVGQYNLRMQTLQNVGALTASLGPLAGGYGYAGGAPTSNASYTPAGGTIGGTAVGGPPPPGYGGVGGNPGTGTPGNFGGGLGRFFSTSQNFGPLGG